MCIVRIFSTSWLSFFISHHSLNLPSLPLPLPLPLQDAQIKKMTGNNTYGFVHFLDLMSAVIAKQRMDGSLMRASRLKVGGVGLRVGVERREGE